MSDPTETTEDGFLGGQLRLRQLKSGHRAGHDAVLLAAATAARPGDRVVEFGAGVGAAGLALARRVGETRDAVHHQVVLVAAARRKALAYDERVAAARDQIAAVREAAAASAAHLAEVSGAREASLVQLKGDIVKWIDDVKKIRAEEARERREAEASEAEANAGAEEEVGRWLGGPYSIPTYIVMCESGGNYSAVNASSGAGGAYQFLPSTWQSLGFSGLPENASPATQDAAFAKEYAQSGTSAWSPYDGC